MEGKKKRSRANCHLGGRLPDKRARFASFLNVQTEFVLYPWINLGAFGARVEITIASKAT
jgi:hypothetical protein